MNLAITPVGIKNTYSQQNYTKNNSQAQNFGAINVKFKNDLEYTPRQLDQMVEVFLCHFENAAKKVGLDTEKLNKKGYKLEIDDKDFDYHAYASASLLNKENKVVQNNCYIHEDSQQETAETFVNNIKKLMILG